MSDTIIDGRKCRRCFTKVRTQYLRNGLCRGCYSDTHMNKPEKESKTKIDPELLRIIRKL